MLFSVRVSNNQKNTMLNICDAKLLGKKISQDEVKMNISESYYGEKLVDRDQAKSLLQNSSIINMVGKNTVSLCIELGLGSESAIKTISDIPFLIIYKI